MVAYEEFIEKLKLFLNNSDILLNNKKIRYSLTNDDAEKILNRKLQKIVKNFDSNKILEDNYKDKILEDNYNDIINVFKSDYMITDGIFCPYRSYDYSFLNIYNENVKKVIINQIELDSNGCSILFDYINLYDTLNNIDDLVTLTEFYLNPPSQLKLLNEKKLLNEEKLRKFLE
jgi:hypothetical protein